MVSVRRRRNDSGDSTTSKSATTTPERFRAANSSSASGRLSSATNTFSGRLGASAPVPTINSLPIVLPDLEGCRRWSLVNEEPEQSDLFDRQPKTIEIDRFLDITVGSQLVAAD